jgi:hypothetical protein
MSPCDIDISIFFGEKKNLKILDPSVSFPSMFDSFMRSIVVLEYIFSSCVIAFSSFDFTPLHHDF